MGRLQNFKGLSSHLWYRNLYRRLSLADLATCEAFITSRESMTKDEYCYDALQWGVTIEKVESRNYPIMQELVLVAGTMEEQ